LTGGEGRPLILRVKVPLDSERIGGAECGVVGVAGSGSSTNVCCTDLAESRLFRPNSSEKDDLGPFFATEPLDKLELALEDGVDGEAELVGLTGELVRLGTEPLRTMLLISSALNWIKGAALELQAMLLFLFDLWSRKDSSLAVRST